MAKKISFLWLSCIQNRSVAQSCPTLCDTMNRSTPGLPVHHQLPEFTQTHVHRVSDAIQPSQLLSSPSPPAPNPSQHQSFSNESALHMRWPKYWSFSLSLLKQGPHPTPHRTTLLPPPVRLHFGHPSRPTVVSLPANNNLLLSSF